MNRKGCEKNDEHAVLFEVAGDISVELVTALEVQRTNILCEIAVRFGNTLISARQGGLGAPGAILKAVNNIG